MRHLDQAFEPRVILDVEEVKVDLVGPMVVAMLFILGTKQVLDLVIVDMHS